MLTVAMPLSFCVLRVASPVFSIPINVPVLLRERSLSRGEEKAPADGEEVRKKKRRGVGTSLSLLPRSPRACSQASLCYILNKVVIIAG